MKVNIKELNTITKYQGRVCLQLYTMVRNKKKQVQYTPLLRCNSVVSYQIERDLRILSDGKRGPLDVIQVLEPVYRVSYSILISQ